MTTTEVAPTTPLTEAEAHDAMQLARANHQAAKSDVETFRALAEQGREVDPHDYAAARTADELTAIRVAASEAAHTKASEREATERREQWADSVRPTLEALDAAAAAAGDGFTNAARALVAAIKVREDAIDRFHSEANAVGESGRVEINQYSGVQVDHYALRHNGTRILSEVAPAFCALLVSAGEPGQAENFRISHKGAGLPRPKDGK